MALGSTQPLIEMSTKNRLGGKRRWARKVDNINVKCKPKICEPRRLTILWVFTACYRDSFTFLPILNFQGLLLDDPFKYCLPI
jgi:hypothetical protein